MSIIIKTPEQIAKMRTACQLAAEVLTMLDQKVKPGVTTEELNTLCHNFIMANNAIPAPLNYKGFPKSICTSINHVVCHGIPNDKPLRNGDIINVDVTVIKDGMHGDTSKMYAVGKCSPISQRLMLVTKKALYEGIKVVKPGAKLGDIGHAIQQFSEAEGFSVVRDFCGHGIGEQFHEEPQVLHYGKRNTGISLSEGMIFTIEPMINVGKPDTKILSDNWTAVTRDRSLSAQWEHTCLVTADGCEILTLRPDETKDNMT